MKNKAFTAVSIALMSFAAIADDMSDGSFYEELTIVGKELPGVTGSAYYIGPEQLKRFAYSDIQRISRQVPGVSIQVEDGYGLRPNISIRGVATERSGRITLLEDNVLIAPAPYSAPSAYYFPTVGRMHAFEVLKGPAAITQGPYTIGGAFNMLSTPIPAERNGNVMFEVGEDATYRAHAYYGETTAAGFGLLLETHQWRSDGFQEIDGSNRDSGLDVQDYMLKLSYAPTDSAHHIELKLQYAEQDSNQSYLGLTDNDFAADAYRRYGLSALDNISTRHEQVILRYQFAPSDALQLSATAYNNEHERDWFKTEGIDLDGSANAQEFDRTSWANIVRDVNNGEAVDGFTATDLQAILDGTQNTLPGSIQLRSNNREYFSRGLQLGVEWSAQLGATSHSLEAGIRYHQDEEDRLQRNSTYSQQDGTLQLDDLGLLGNAGNRLQEAEALAVHVYDRIEIGRWAFTPGVRYENIKQDRTRFETRADETADPAARGADNIRDTRENDTEVWLPGVGVLYQVNAGLSFLGGVHKGFTAPTNAPDVDEEEALNYEAGLRYQDDRVQAELVAFLSDYDNLLGVCTNSSGSDCEIGDAFNGDAATIQGLELLLVTNLAAGSAFNVPLALTYTYTDGEFDSDIEGTDFFGDVSAGDPIPYIPEHQLYLSVGLEQSAWGAYLSANYVDETCVRASCDTFETTDDSLTLDLAANYQLNTMVNLFARVENLTDEEDILGRQPYGARPNKARTASVGVRLTF